MIRTAHSSACDVSLSIRTNSSVYSAPASVHLGILWTTRSIVSELAPLLRLSPVALMNSLFAISADGALRLFPLTLASPMWLSAQLRLVLLLPRFSWGAGCG